MTCLQIQNIEAKAQSDLEKKNMAISDLERVSPLQCFLLSSLFRGDILWRKHDQRTQLFLTDLLLTVVVQLARVKFKQGEKTVETKLKQREAVLFRDLV